MREPVPPRTLSPNVPLDLETICLKCLEKDRRRRYDSARTLTEELQRFLAGKAILARPISRPARARRRPWGSLRRCCLRRDRRWRCGW